MLFFKFYDFIIRISMQNKLRHSTKQIEVFFFILIYAMSFYIVYNVAIKEEHNANHSLYSSSQNNTFINDIR